MPESESHEDSSVESNETLSFGRFRSRIGFALIILSGVFWFSLFAVPFLPLSTGQKAAVAGALFVGVQLAWWSGAALVGAQTVKKLTKAFSRR